MFFDIFKRIVLDTLMECLSLQKWDEILESILEVVDVDILLSFELILFQYIMDILIEMI